MDSDGVCDDEKRESPLWVEFPSANAPLLSQLLTCNSATNSSFWSILASLSSSVICELGVEFWPLELPPSPPTPEYCGTRRKSFGRDVGVPRGFSTVPGGGAAGAGAGAGAGEGVGAGRPPPACCSLAVRSCGKGGWD